MIVYLREYYELWIIFSKLDQNYNGRVEYNELINNEDILVKWKIDPLDTEVLFK